MLELAVIENLQREDLNPIEEAVAFAKLAKDFGLRQEDIAQKVGKSRAAIANSMRLLDLDSQVQSWLTQDRITVGHAKVLLSLKTQARTGPPRRGDHPAAAHGARGGKTDRRSFCKERRGEADTWPEQHTRADCHGAAIQHLQNRLQQHLATHVTLQHGEKRGRIEMGTMVRTISIAS